VAGMRTTALVLLIAGASNVSGEAVELTGKNFAKNVLGHPTRSALVKFLAPW